MNADECAAGCDRPDLVAEIERMREEVEQHARVDYWAERYRDQTKEMADLREKYIESLNMIVSLKDERDKWRSIATQRAEMLGIDHE